MAKPGRRGTTRLAGIEGLRAVAALSILALHSMVDVQARADLGWPGRWLALILPAGLTLFFVLSGFLLFRPIASAILRDAELPHVGRYLISRALRIVPAYVVILLVAALVLGAVRVEPSKFAYGYLTEPVTLAKNLLLVQNYSPSTVVTGIPASWSLQVEVAFYLLLPILAAPAARLAAGRQVGARIGAALLPAALLLVIGLAGKAWAAATYDAADPWAQEWGATWHAVLERSILASADLFAFGMAAAVLTAAATQGLISPRRVRAAGGRIVAYVLPLAVLVRPALDDRVFTSAMAFAFAGLVAWMTLPAETPPRLVRALERRPLVFVGVISYSVYLWHQPVIFALDDQGLLATGRAGVALNVTLVSAVTLVLAAVTYRLVEAPAIAARRRFSGRRAREVAAIPRPEPVADAPSA